MLKENELPINQIIHGDCLDFMRKLPPKSIDLVLTDPPYGMTNNKWDSILDSRLLVSTFLKISGIAVMFSMQPYTTELIHPNKDVFKYCWTWKKAQARGFLNAWKQPLRITEDICVFYKNQCYYNPQITDKPSENIRPITDSTKLSDCYGKRELNIRKLPKDKSLPNNIIEINNTQEALHPTQKPVKLMEYFILTYSKENDLILDPFSGSGTTAIACHRLNRRFICVEKEKKYVDLSRRRLEEEQAQGRLF